MTSKRTSDEMLHGTIDLHVHTYPDVRRRRSSNDFEAAVEARDSGMQAIVLKSHDVVTSDRAYLVRKVVSGIEVFGGVALDSAVGGLNPSAVRAAAGFVPELRTCRIVWMPTIDARNYRSKRFGVDDGLEISNGSQLKPVIHEILDIVSSNDLVLATGHLAYDEQILLISQATAQGVSKILVNHAENDYLDFSPDQQLELYSLGALLEHTLAGTMGPSPQSSLDKIAENVLAVGAEKSVLSTDLGPEDKPRPVAGMRLFIEGMAARGISENEIEVMTVHNPAMLLGLGTTDK